jgi:hypothetical protein
MSSSGVRTGHRVWGRANFLRIKRRLAHLH